MVKLVSIRSVKKVPKKRGYTHAEKVKEYSKGNLIDILVEAPDEVINEYKQKIKNPSKVLARKLLIAKFHLTIDDINTIIKSKIERRERIRDISNYYRGTMTPEEVASKHKKINPESVHIAAKNIHKFEVPGDQKPIGISNPVLGQYYKLRNAAMNHEIPYEVFVDWLLDLAYKRPEFAANLAYIIFTDDTENYKLLGKKGKLLKAKMESIITERRIALNKQNPLVHKPKDFTLAHQYIESVMDGKNKNIYTTEAADEGGHTEKALIPGNVLMEERKKQRKNRFLSRKKSRKIIKVKKPIKKCRCR